MQATELWARVRRLGTHGLRRGAWYPVVNRSKPEVLVVDVAKKNVLVPRDAVDLSEAPPKAWSVVVWKERDPGVRRVSDAGFALRYVVCPTCRGRVELPDGEPERMTCPSCNGDYGFDWAHPC
jgi:hypothetical protein